MKNVFFASFFGAACCLSGCRQEAATPATGEHYAFAEEMFRKVWDMYRVPEYGLFSEYYPNSHHHRINIAAVFHRINFGQRDRRGEHPVHGPQEGNLLRAFRPVVEIIYIGTVAMLIRW